MVTANLSTGRAFPCLLCLLYFVYPLCFPGLAAAQQPPVDAAEISRDLLYHPARLIESSWAGPELRLAVFRAAEFTYRLLGPANQWEVVREKNAKAAAVVAPLKIYRSDRLGADYSLAAASTDDEGILNIRGPAGGEPLARVRLWERRQLAAAWLEFLRQDAPGLTAEALAKDLEIADPEVAGVADDGAYLWLAIRYSTGEGSRGVGTLVRFDPKTNEAKIYQPTELATSSITHIVSAGGALWLGTHLQGEGGIAATKGLVRFNPASGEVRSYLPGSSPLVGRIVTALANSGGTLLVATDAGTCRVERAGSQQENWTCWRIVPTVQLGSPAPVSNRPGVPPGGQLPAGGYEVRWANVTYVEVLTADWIEGWVATDDFEDYVRRNFDGEAYELANTSGGGATPIRLVAKPGGDPLAGALVYRAPLERVGSPTPAGWQLVRARVGWISRKNLEVAPVVRRVPPASAPAP